MKLSPNNILNESGHKNRKNTVTNLNGSGFANFSSHGGQQTHKIVITKRVQNRSSVVALRLHTSEEK